MLPTWRCEFINCQWVAPPRHPPASKPPTPRYCKYLHRYENNRLHHTSCQPRCFPTGNFHLALFDQVSARRRRNSALQPALAHQYPAGESTCTLHYPLFVQVFSNMRDSCIEQGASLGHMSRTRKRISMRSPINYIQCVRGCPAQPGTLPTLVRFFFFISSPPESSHHAIRTNVPIPARAAGRGWSQTRTSSRVPADVLIETTCWNLYQYRLTRQLPPMKSPSVSTCLAMGGLNNALAVALVGFGRHERVAPCIANERPLLLPWETRYGKIPIIMQTRFECRLRCLGWSWVGDTHIEKGRSREHLQSGGKQQHAICTKATARGRLPTQPSNIEEL